MRRIRSFVACALASALVVATLTSSAVAQDDKDKYTEFRDCVRKKGTGLECVDKLPEDDKFRTILGGLNTTPSSSVADLVPRPSFFPGGLNTTSAASILLQKQLPLGQGKAR